jgi:iron-sulfur cluster assembly protein
MERLTLNLERGEILLDRLLQDGIGIAHDCGGKLACTSCQIMIREGMEGLDAASEDELDLLDRSGAADPGARLACQVSGVGELSIEIFLEDAPVHASMLAVTVSERAAEYLAEQLAKHPSAVAVRLVVEPSGCSGHGYRIEPSQIIRDEDSVFESRRLRIVIDAASMPYLQGTRLDVMHQGLARRVIFDNPNARETCGCGESFGVLTSSDRRTSAES